MEKEKTRRDWIREGMTCLYLFDKRGLRGLTIVLLLARKVHIRCALLGMWLQVTIQLQSSCVHFNLFSVVVVRQTWNFIFH